MKINFNIRTSFFPTFEDYKISFIYDVKLLTFYSIKNAILTLIECPLSIYTHQWVDVF
jgi:hypothetical protein